MKRLRDWEPRLVQYLGENARTEFSYGSHDCALFVAGAVAAMTGENYVSLWGAKYKTLAGGIKELKKRGYSDHVAYVASILEEIHPAFAHKGDIAVLPGEGDGPAKALGIVQGEGVFVLTPKGMAVTSRRNIERAFRL